MLESGWGCPRLGSYCHSFGMQTNELGLVAMLVVPPVASYGSLLASVYCSFVLVAEVFVLDSTTSTAIDTRALTTKMTSNHRWKKLNCTSPPTTSVITVLRARVGPPHTRHGRGQGLLPHIVGDAPILGRQVHSHQKNVRRKIPGGRWAMAGEVCNVQRRKHATAHTRNAHAHHLGEQQHH